MSRNKPKYALHKATGQARVRLAGKDHYLGTYDSPESRLKYEELVGRFLSNRKLDSSSFRCDRLALQYLTHAKAYYRKNGKKTSEVHAIRVALRHLVMVHGNTLCLRFGPKALVEVRDSMVAAGIVRASVNRNIGRIRRAFKWAVSQEFLPVDIWQRLQTVEGLAKGRSQAVESEPVMPVTDEQIQAVIQDVGRQVAAMIQVQILTGARPGEVCAMTGAAIDDSSEVWTYAPASHKTEHHGRERLLFIGPKAQAALRPFLKDDPLLPLFSPAEARAEHNARRRASRKVKVWPSHEKNRPGNGVQDLAKPYSESSYRNAIRRACERAGIPTWHPNQLRHNAATELRKTFGIEAARTVLGHTSLSVTEIYAEVDRGKARDAMKEVG